MLKKIIILSYICFSVVNIYAEEDRTDQIYTNLSFTSSTIGAKFDLQLDNYQYIENEISSFADSSTRYFAKKVNPELDNYLLTACGNTAKNITQHLIKEQSLTIDRTFGLALGIGWYVNNYYSLELSYSNQPDVNMQVDLNGIIFNKSFLSTEVASAFQHQDVDLTEDEILSVAKSVLLKFLRERGNNAYAERNIIALLATKLSTNVDNAKSLYPTLVRQSHAINDMMEDGKIDYLRTQILDKLQIKFTSQQLLINNNFDLNFMEYKNVKPYLSFGVGVARIESDKMNLSIDLDKQYIKADFGDGVEKRSIFRIVKEDFEQYYSPNKFPYGSSIFTPASVQVKDQFAPVIELGVGLKIAATDNMDIVAGGKLQILPSVEYTLESPFIGSETAKLPYLSNTYFVGVNYFM